MFEFLIPLGILIVVCGSSLGTFISTIVSVSIEQYTFGGHDHDWHHLEIEHDAYSIPAGVHQASVNWTKEGF